MSECEEWPTHLTPQGYARLTIDGTEVYAHRLAWMQDNGSVPDGMEVDHLCFNRACFAIEHLEVVTPRENSRRRAQRRAACAHGHPWTEASTYTDGLGKRHCRPCGAARARRYRA